MAWTSLHGRVIDKSPKSAGTNLHGYKAKKSKRRPAPTTDPKPDMSWTKADILDWLSTNGVDISDPAVQNLLKAELLDLATDVADY